MAMFHTVEGEPIRSETSLTFMRSRAMSTPGTPEAESDRVSRAAAEFDGPPVPRRQRSRTDDGLPADVSGRDSPTSSTGDAAEAEEKKEAAAGAAADALFETAGRAERMDREREEGNVEYKRTLANPGDGTPPRVSVRGLG